MKIKLLLTPLEFSQVTGIPINEVFHRIKKQELKNLRTLIHYYYTFYITRGECGFEFKCFEECQLEESEYKR